MNENPARFPRDLADARRAIRHVFIRDLELDARIGVHGPEKGRPQPVRINIDLAVTEQNETTDDALQNVVCYEKVVGSVKAIIDSGHVNLVETLADRIAAACLRDVRVNAVRVRVEKLVAIPEARSVGVEIERIQPSR